MKLCRYIIIILIFHAKICMSQNLEHIYIKPDCNIHIFKISNDTIKAYGSPNCTILKADSSINGMWIIYSYTDSNTILYKAKIFKNNLEGLVYIRQVDLDNQSFIYYSNGKKNGPFLQLTLNGKIKFFGNYDMDKFSSDYYFYKYDQTGKLVNIYRYNKNGRLKKEKDYSIP